MTDFDRCFLTIFLETFARNVLYGMANAPRIVGKFARKRTSDAICRVGGGRPARQPDPLDRAFALLDPLLACSAVVVDSDAPAGRLG